MLLYLIVVVVVVFVCDVCVEKNKQGRVGKTEPYCGPCLKFASFFGIKKKSGAFLKLFPNGLKGSKNVPIRAAVLGSCKDAVAVCSRPEAAQRFHRSRPLLWMLVILGAKESHFL